MCQGWNTLALCFQCCILPPLAYYDKEPERETKQILGVAHPLFCSLLFHLPITGGIVKWTLNNVFGLTVLNPHSQQRLKATTVQSLYDYPSKTRRDPRVDFEQPPPDNNNLWDTMSTRVGCLS